MTIVNLVDAENCVLSWIKTTSVNGLVNGKIYLAVPTGNPLPRVILSQVSGAPANSHVAYEEARISFHCTANNRPQAKAIALALINEVESLSYQIPPIAAGGRLVAATTLNKLWLPDITSDISRYVCDFRFVIQPV